MRPRPAAVSGAAAHPSRQPRRCRPSARGEHWLTARISRGPHHRTGQTPRRSRLGGQTHGAPPIGGATPIQPVIHDPPISPAHRIGRNIPPCGPALPPYPEPRLIPPDSRGVAAHSTRQALVDGAHQSGVPPSHGANSPTIPAWWTSSRGPTHRRGDPHPARHP